MTGLLYSVIIVLVSTMDVLGQTTNQPCYNINFDKFGLIFVLDGSGSVEEVNFKKVLTFVQNVVQNLRIGASDALVGVEQYSDNPKMEINLGEFKDEEKLIQKIGKIKYMEGGTKTGAAIKVAISELKTKGRHDVPKVIIVITDGESNDEVKSVSDNARKEGMELIAVGINEAVKAELLQIAGDEKHVYMLEQFDHMENVTDPLTMTLRMAANKKCFEEINEHAKIEVMAERSEVSMDEIVRLTCVFTPSNPEIHYKWFRNDQEVLNGTSNITVENGISHLVVTKNSDLIEEYKCKGTHPVGASRESNSVNITLAAVTTVRPRSTPPSCSCETKPTVVPPCQPRCSDKAYVLKTNRFVNEVRKKLKKLLMAFKDCALLQMNDDGEDEDEDWKDEL